MDGRDSFSRYHPAVNFVYFALVLIFGMTLMHPACLFTALVCSTAYALRLSGVKALKFQLKYLLPLMLLTAAIGPLFNHQGATALCRLPSGNALTLESILFSAASSLMLISVINWFSCYNAVMTSDKFIYLFGRIIPSLSLVLSMALRFVPGFKNQIKRIAAAQKRPGEGREGVFRKASAGLKILSAAVTWALENSIVTADSMRSRGFGLRGRTAFSIYKFTGRDAAALAILLLCAAYMAAGAALGAFTWRYYPTVKGSFSLYSLSVTAAYLCLCLFPLGADLKEDAKWAGM